MVDVIRYEELPSTNDEAIRLAREDAPEGTVVWALEQSRGRGRHGRDWQSPPGNAYLTVLVRPELPPRLSGRLAVAAGQAVALFLETFTALPVRTKWPNDLYLHRRKVGGILVETSGGTDTLGWAVIGVGVNAETAPPVPPPGVPSIALSSAGWNGSVELLVSGVASVVMAASDACTSEAGWRAVTADWPARDHAFGPVEVMDENPWRGSGAGLDDDGALLVLRDGVMTRVIADVTVRTAAEVEAP